MRRSAFLVLLLPLIVLLASSCGKLQSGDVSGPGDLPDGGPAGVLNVQTNATDNIPQLPFAEGDSVYISGTICPAYERGDWKARDFYGTIQGGQIVGSYRRVVSSDRDFTIKLYVRNADHRFAPVFDNIRANGVLLTATTDPNPWDIFRQFHVRRLNEGGFEVQPIRDDSGRFMETSCWYNGISFTDPDSLVLNENAFPDDPIYVSSAWNGLDGCPTIWDGLSWGSQIRFVSPGDYLVRFSNRDDVLKVTGCHIGDLELHHLVGIGPPELPYWMFKITVLEDWTVVNAGPDNRFGDIGIGMMRKGARPECTREQLFQYLQSTGSVPPAAL